MTPIKVTIEDVEFGGFYVVKDGMITVTGPTGRTKTTQAGGADVAEIMLCEIVTEAMGIVPDGVEKIEIELNP